MKQVGWVSNLGNLTRNDDDDDDDDDTNYDDDHDGDGDDNDDDDGCSPAHCKVSDWDTTA